MNHSFADHSPGMSFKGAMAYYMHDRREVGETTHPASSDRVAWTSTRNLATGRPDVATAVMVATAKDSDRLKKQAGVRVSGRKAKAPVKTFALSWHPEEAASLDRAEMERAANAALEAVGMEKHQAVIVCHNDTRHPHVHVVVNRVNPETGKLARCGPNENRSLDRWAYEYERDRGNIVSPNRAAKYERQDRLKRRYNADERRDYVRRKQPQRKDSNRSQTLLKRSSEQRRKHKQEWADLSERYKNEKRSLRDEWSTKFHNARHEFDKRHKGLWKQYGRDKWRRRREFEMLDSTFYGRLSLSIQAAQMQRSSGDPAFKKVGLARLTWINLQNPELRNATVGALEKQHLEAFKRWHGQSFKPRQKQLRQERSQAYRDAYGRFREERIELLARQKGERADLKSMWRSNSSENKGRAYQGNRSKKSNSINSLEALRMRMKGKEMEVQQRVAGQAANSFNQSTTKNPDREDRAKATDAFARLRSKSSNRSKDNPLERER